MERASLVIVNWNAGAALHACLADVFSSDGIDRDQVILVDNASTDGSQFGLTATYPALELIQNSRNVGFARAVNQAVSGRVGIVRPLAGLDKRQVMRLGREMPLEWTFSCLSPAGGLHCGGCNKCAERRQAFRLAELEDPTAYAGARRVAI